jgi:hypothetical protein
VTDDDQELQNDEARKERSHIHLRFAAA